VILVVSDTSAIRALAHLDCLKFLPALFDEVVVPPSVHLELLNPPASFQRVNVAKFNFFCIQTPSNKRNVKSLRQTLDGGEAEAIVLAEELHAKWLLIDEKAGRALAQQRGLAVVGTLGVLLRMKEQGDLQRIAPLLDILQSELGFFLSPTVRVQILQMAGEDGA